MCHQTSLPLGSGRSPRGPAARAWSELATHSAPLVCGGGSSVPKLARSSRSAALSSALGFPELLPARRRLPTDLAAELASALSMGRPSRTLGRWRRSGVPGEQHVDYVLLLDDMVFDLELEPDEVDRFSAEDAGAVSMLLERDRRGRRGPLRDLRRVGAPVACEDAQGRLDWASCRSVGGSLTVRRVGSAPRAGLSRTASCTLVV